MNAPAKLDPSYKQILEACEEFKRHHLEWPTAKATEAQFKEARVLMDGISGATLNAMLRNPSEKVSADPDFQEMRQLVYRAKLRDVDLSVIDPKSYMQMDPQSLKKMVEDIQGGLYVKSGCPMRREGHSSIYVRLPTAFNRRVVEKAGLEWSGMLRATSGMGAWVLATPEVTEFLTRSRAIYGPKAVNQYYFEIMENDRIYMKYQHIIGSRYAGEMTPELWGALENRLAEQLRADFDKLPTHQQAGKIAAPQRSLKDELALLIATDGVLALPKQQLAHYQDIKALLEKAGGSYVQNKKVFKFEDGIDCADIQRRLMAEESINFQQQWQFFATPKEEVSEMCDEIPCIRGKRVLEPSAGDGAIAVEARAQGAREVVTIEAWNVNAIKLREKGFNPIERDFLTVTPAEIGKFDVILANPPFTKNQDIDHFMHMLNFLQPGGSMSVIMSPGWQTGSHTKHVAFREFLKTQGVEVNDIEAGAFSASGTGIGTVRVTIPAYRPVMRAAMSIHNDCMDNELDDSDAQAMSMG